MPSLLFFIFVVIGITCCQPPIQAQDTLCRPFVVDARNLPPGTQVGLRGSIPPLSWDKTYPLTDTDKDGIFEGTVCFLPKNRAEVLEYKFVYGTTTITYELPEGNRIWVLSDSLFARQEKWDVATPIAVDKLPPLAIADAQRDIQLLKEALQALHPGINRYKTTQQVDSVFAAALKSITAPVSLQQMFLKVASLAAYLQCGHTFSNYQNQTALVKQVIFHQADKLPLHCRWLNDKLYVTAVADPACGVQPGDEITRIQQQDVASLWQKMMPYISADGNNAAARQYLLQLNGIDPLEPLDVCLPLLYPPGTMGYELHIKKQGSQQEETFWVKPLTAAQRHAQIKQLNHHMDSLWSFRLMANQTAYLRLSTFDGFMLPFEWSTYLTRVFGIIQKTKTKHLVLDIRGNAGGQDEIALALGKFISTQPVQPIPRKSKVRFRTVPDSLRPYIFTWNKSFYEIGIHAAPDGEGMYNLPDDALQIMPQKKPFAGAVYLLTDAGNRSATFYLAELAKSNQLATLVGQPTSGSQQGLNGGGFIFFRLPHSGIEVDIPLIGSFSPEKPAMGIEPDYHIQPHAEDFRNGTDRVQEWVLQQIAIGRTK